MRKPIADGAGLDDLAGEGEPVDDGGAKTWIGEGLGPAGEGLVGGDRDRRVQWRPGAISPYLGQTAFDRAIADFAKRYAVQNQRDYLAFPQAIDSGRLAAEQGV